MDTLAPVPSGWADDLLRGREATRAAFRDPARSPLATVARHDLPPGRVLVLGSGDEADVVLPGLGGRHLAVRVEGDHFALEGLDGGTFSLPVRGAEGAALAASEAPPGARVRVGRYLLRLSHQNFPAVLVIDPESPEVQSGPEPRWWPPDPAFRVAARLVAPPGRREVVVQSTLGHLRRALHLGALEFTLRGEALALSALRLLEPGTGEASVSVFFRDATTGGESYGVGRYVDPEQEGEVWVLDFNRAYNPTCAYNPHYNCPIPPRENHLPVAVEAGERSPE